MCIFRFCTWTQTFPLYVVSVVSEERSDEIKSAPTPLALVVATSGVRRYQVASRSQGSFSASRFRTGYPGTGARRRGRLVCRARVLRVPAVRACASRCSRLDGERTVPLPRSRSTTHPDFLSISASGPAPVPFPRQCGLVFVRGVFCPCIRRNVFSTPTNAIPAA